MTKIPFSKSSPVSIKFESIFGKILINDNENTKSLYQESSFLLNIFLENLYFVEQGILQGSFSIGISNDNSDVDIILFCSLDMYKLALFNTPDFVMQFIVKTIKTNLKDNYSILIDYPSITITNKDTKSKFDFTPMSVPSKEFQKKTKYKGRYNYFKNDSEMEGGFFDVDRNKLNPIDEKEILKLHSNQKYKVIKKMVNNWIKSHSPVYDNIPKYYFYDLITTYGDKITKDSLQQIFNNVLLRMLIELDMFNHQVRMGTKYKGLNEINNNALNIIREADAISTKAIALEKNKKYEDALKHWNTVFNNKLY